MKTLLKVTLALMIVTAVIVWFIPGVDLWIEAVFQQYLGRAAQ